MKKHLLRIAVLLVLCCAMFGCKPDDNSSGTGNGMGSIYGTVTDKSTGDCVPIAGVELMPKGLKTVTGSDGTFQFTDIEAGQYNLFITKVGYQDYKSNTITVKAGETAKGDAQIEKMPASLQIVDNSGNAITEIDFGSDQGVTSKTFNIFNGGVETLNYTITKTADWIESISQPTGSVNVGVTFPIILQINRDLLSDGVNNTTLLITSPSAGGKELVVKATKSAPHTGNCTVVFELFSSTSDGWYSGYSSASYQYAQLGVSDGISTYQLTIEYGNNVANYTYDFEVGTNISVVYSHGYYSDITDDYSYRIYYSDGEVIFEKAQGTISSGLQCSFTVDCEGTGGGGTGGGGGNGNGAATIILSAGDVWNDGTGYQLLLDQTHSLYGTTIPETGALSENCSGNESIYAKFSHKIPSNADGNCSTSHVVVNNSVSITIPAGTYDWCITNPTPDDRIWIASSNGNVGGRQDDYEFEAGNTYKFVPSMFGEHDGVDVTITGGAKGKESMGGSNDGCRKK